jgi:hypothetical protein
MLNSTWAWSTSSVNVSRALNGLFNVLLKQHRTNLSADVHFIGEDVEHINAALDFVVRTLGGVDIVLFGATVLRESRANQHSSVAVHAHRNTGDASLLAILHRASIGPQVRPITFYGKPQKTATLL